jgi:hypothetical protein
MEMVPIFQQVVASGDRYGLHAYLTAVENANALAKLEHELQTCASPVGDEKERLQSVLRSGSLITDEVSGPPSATKVAAFP